jgi:glycine/D-amino acid oxidase-like deaminating enzyme/nitrite reductase/ring-hydroxylating ferredoxin subunit
MTVSAEQSLWLEEEGRRYQALDGHRDADVAVVGGGITGLTTALLLKREGVRVVLLEAGRVGSGVTGCNTAKVTALQSTVLSTIRSTHGAEATSVYAQANLAAVERLVAIARDQGIDCDIERRAAYTYAADEAELGAIEAEAETAAEAGLPVVLTEDADLPFPVAGAVRLDDQIEFHPVRYARGLAAAVDGQESSVFEGSRVLEVSQGAPCRVRTHRGRVTAEQVVLATHYPLLDRGVFFARLEPQRSYCIAARVRGAPSRGMSISAGETTRSVRSCGDLVIVSGEGHPTGAGEATATRYARLEEFARTHWDVDEVTHRWSAQDPVSYDDLPVIGPYLPRSSRLFVASGFMKWGLTGGTFAAHLLSDQLAGRGNAWSKIFAPNRLSPRSAPKLAQVNAKVGLDFVGDRARLAEVDTPAAVPRGSGRVMRDGLGKTGVYRDEAGKVYAVSLRCTHLGCLLRFNGAERSWDCPCHGSRFDVDGTVLEGPAVSPLERKATDRL